MLTTSSTTMLALRQTVAYVRSSEMETVNDASSVSRRRISLSLQLKRLHEFSVDDLKRYYEAVDRNVDVNDELHGKSNLR